jgi:hypothetical protein
MNRMTRPNDHYYGELRSKYNHVTMHKSRRYKTFKGAWTWAQRKLEKIKFANELYVHVTVVVVDSVTTSECVEPW